MKKLFLYIGLMIVSALPLRTQAKVLQIFQSDKYQPVELNSIDSIEVTNIANRLSLRIAKFDGSNLSIDLTDSVFHPVDYTCPLIEINTFEELEEIPNKIDFKDASIRISGFESYDDYSGEMQIRGRGNSSWENPKKPYRLKFSKKVSLCGLNNAKNYVLLANYVDPTLMLNSVASKIAQMLELPYTPEYVPVDVQLNGVYRGSYVLTNKPGINAGSVDIDEENSVMWELDSYFDEDLKFRSPIYQLPVNLADPDMTEEQFKEWEADFIEMEEAVAKVEADDYIDLDSYAIYLLVHDIMKNDELSHPKSVKFYKSKGGKYIFGPLWDFDGALSYWTNSEIFSFENINRRVERHAFFFQMEKHQAVVEAYQKHFHEIKERLPELMDYIDQYAEQLKYSYERNINHSYFPDQQFDEAVSKMKEWIMARMAAMESFDIMKK